MASNVIKGNDFDVKKFSVGEKKPLQNGAELANLMFEGKSRFQFETPRMAMPYGISPPNEKVPKYSAVLRFEGMDRMPKLRAFHTNMSDLDEHMVLLGIQNVESWWGSSPDFKRAMVEAKKAGTDKAQAIRSFVVGKYKPMVGTSDKYADSLRLQVREVPVAYIRKDGKNVADPDAGTKLETVLYDSEGNLIDYGDKKDNICVAVPRDSEAVSRIEPGGVWFSSLGYGVSLRLVLARVKAGSFVQGPPEWDDDGQDGEGETAAPVAAKSHAPAKASHAKTVAAAPEPESSDNDGEGEEKASDESGEPADEKDADESAESNPEQSEEADEEEEQPAVAPTPAPPAPVAAVRKAATKKATVAAVATVATPDEDAGETVAAVPPPVRKATRVVRPSK